MVFLLRFPSLHYFVLGVCAPTLRDLIWQRLGSADPPLRSNTELQEALFVDLGVLKGRLLQQYEDRLDAIFCAYLALYYWTWGAKRNEMIGDMDTGYIINPTATI